MKQLAIIITFLSLMLTVQGQPRSEHMRETEPREAPKIEEFVSNLSAKQRASITELIKKHSTLAAQYRKELQAVRDSIRIIMDDPADRSADIYPLFEREGRLMAQLSKIYYIGRVEIERVLTAEQRKVLRQKTQEERMQPPRPPHANPPKDKRVQK